MKRESRTVDPSHQVESPTQRHLPLVDLLVDTRAELMELAVASGLKVLTTMLEADRTAICGPRYQHQDDRVAVRAGTVSSEVVLGGRKVQLRRPRVRAEGKEVALPTFEAFADTDPLNRRVVEQMLLGVATRQYGRSLEFAGADIRTRGTSKSAVSRRFVAKTAAQLAAWRSTSLDTLDLVALLIDGVISPSTASSPPSALITPAENTHSAYGTGRRKTRPSVRASWPICRAAACARIGACW